MAESISLQNGSEIQTSSSANHDVKFTLQNEEIILKMEAKFPKGTSPIKINQTRLPDDGFEMGEIELLLNQPLGKDEIVVFATSDADDHYLNIKIKCNQNTFKKWMFSGPDDKKWMFE